MLVTHEVHRLKSVPLSRPRPQFLPLPNYVIQPFLRVLVAGKALLFGSKSDRVVIASAVYYPGGMFDVQHFMEEDVLDEPLGTFAGIQDLANRDGLMRGVVMAQNAPGSPFRPRQHRLFDLAVKITSIEPREDPFQIIDLAVG